ncbi:MAG: hypothetical protein ACFNWW_04350 [Negativicutes bacterium]
MGARAARKDDAVGVTALISIAAQEKRMVTCGRVQFDFCGELGTIERPGVTKPR